MFREPGFSAKPDVQALGQTRRLRQPGIGILGSGGIVQGPANPLKKLIAARLVGEQRRGQLLRQDERTARGIRVRRDDQMRHSAPSRTGHGTQNEDSAPD